MKAAVNDRYGSPDVLEIREIRKPEPQANEIQVQVHATTVSRTDCGMLRGRPALFVRPIMGLFRPKRTVLGMDFAGTVVAAGAGVTSFRSGERVFGMSPDDFGAHAEYLCMPENGAIASGAIGTAAVQLAKFYGAEVTAVVDFLKARMEAGELHGMIDRRYPLQSIVDAYRYVETAQKTGIVVIRVSPEENWHSSKTGLESSRRVSSLP